MSIQQAAGQQIGNQQAAAGSQIGNLQYNTGTTGANIQGQYGNSLANTYEQLGNVNAVAAIGQDNNLTGAINGAVGNAGGLISLMQGNQNPVQVTSN